MSRLSSMSNEFRIFYVVKCLIFYVVKTRELQGRFK